MRSQITLFTGRSSLSQKRINAFPFRSNPSHRRLFPVVNQFMYIEPVPPYRMSKFLRGIQPQCTSSPHCRVPRKVKPIVIGGQPHNGFWKFAKAIFHLPPAEVPFFWELAQHTLKITNSAGKLISNYWPQDASITKNIYFIPYTESIADFEINENKIKLIIPAQYSRPESELSYH